MGSGPGGITRRFASFVDVTTADYSPMNEQPQIHGLDAADTSRIVPLGRVDLVELGGIAFDRATFQPGWRWSEHQESLVEGQLCSQRHLGYLISGRMPETRGSALSLPTMASASASSASAGRRSLT